MTGAWSTLASGDETSSFDPTYYNPGNYYYEFETLYSEDGDLKATNGTTLTDLEEVLQGTCGDFPFPYSSGAEAKIGEIQKDLQSLEMEQYPGMATPRDSGPVHVEDILQNMMAGCPVEVSNQTVPDAEPDMTQPFSEYTALLII